MLAASVEAGFDAEAARAVASEIGARYAQDAYGPQCLFDLEPGTALAQGFVTALTDLGRITVSGPDTRSFLQGQTTNDVAAIGPDDAQWTGYCTAKGRLLASMLAWSGGDECVELLLSRPLVAPIRKRLSMFVLRAKAKLVDRDADTVVLGLGGAATRALERLGLAVPAPLQVVRNGELVAIGLETLGADPASGLPADLARVLLVVPRTDLGAAWATLTATAASASSTLWRWTEVHSAVARISEGTRELFVPQMVNFELVGGVSFTKGCYPGQEVVARSQYLGKLKRRSFRGHVEGPEPAPGADVFAGGGEPTGQVVIAAPAPLGGADLLFEAQVAAVEAARGGEGELRAASPDGARITLAALPYAIPS